MEESPVERDVPPLPAALLILGCAWILMVFSADAPSRVDQDVRTRTAASFLHAAFFGAFGVAGALGVIAKTSKRIPARVVVLAGFVCMAVFACVAAFWMWRAAHAEIAARSPLLWVSAVALIGEVVAGRLLVGRRSAA